MRSRVIPTIPETVLSYRIGEKAAALETAASALGMKHTPIPEDKAGETLGFLAGYGGFSSNGSDISADGECVIFSGISSKRLDLLLKEMRRAGLDIPLKAVITAYNQNQSVEWLLKELAKEREAIAKSTR
ncbi:MAG: DUF3783 domain-containing protein [Oscillospiraceae bacterium]|nr:DUF3783 domain-containing protein [Oscillospiraceae bacterium]